jgi:hypothetical protein
MRENFTYTRFRQMIMISYLVDLNFNKGSDRLKKHLDLLRLRFDPADFTHETVGEYRVDLFNRLQQEIDIWENVRSMNPND